MKELSIEEKAKAYDKAIERARVWKEKSGMPADRQGILDDIFPELNENESEDERISGAIIDHLKDNGLIEWADWLEKRCKKSNNVYDKESSEILGRVIRRYINDPNIPYTEREKVSMEVIPYVERLEKQGEQTSKHFELKSGHWYICHRAFCCRADHLTVKEGERFMCEKDGIVKGFEIKEPEKYFKEVCAPAPMEDEQKPNDKVEPKFKVGDWIIDKQGITDQIVNIIENVTAHTYGYDTINGDYFNDYTEGVRLWTIQDAKDGDVLKEDSCIFIIEKMNPNGTAIVHCCLFDDGDFDLIGSTLSFDVDTTYPATKEQRDLLFQKMKEAGNAWYAENWLKSPKERYTWKPSDEQIKCVSDVVNAAKYKNDISTDGYEPYTHLSKLLQQLKKLREG